MTVDLICCPLCQKYAEMKITAFAGDHVPAEVEYWCSEHGQIGFWAYGYWHPDFLFNEGSLQ